MRYFYADRGLLLARWAFWLCLIAVLVLALIPDNSPLLVSSGWDKANHVLAFTVLGILLNLGHRNRTGSNMISLLLFGGLIEILQSLTPTRSASWADLLADAFGLVLAAGVLWAMHRFVRRRCISRRSC